MTGDSAAVEADRQQRIRDVSLRHISVPLIKPFKTALRTVETAETIAVVITDGEGRRGYGEAPPTLAITGEQLEGIAAFIRRASALLLGQEPLRLEAALALLQRGAVGNSSARAALDMALHDLAAQQAGLPLYRFLGGYRDSCRTDFTVSVDAPERMAQDAADIAASGFRTLKIKVGLGDVSLDIERVAGIRAAVGPGVKLRLDANQGWSAKEAIRAITAMEDAGLDLELVEQPVPARDLKGLAQVTRSVGTLIMADESVFGPQDAMAVLAERAADLINIKLMKAGGIRHAVTICRMAEACGIECMVGSMIETRIGITAAAHFAASQPNVTRFDFDAPLLLSADPVVGGVTYEGADMFLSPLPGLGITDLKAEYMTEL
ncbi:L-Ala-D/L-Glu epimerase [compost metagenome]